MKSLRRLVVGGLTALGLLGATPIVALGAPTAARSAFFRSPSGNIGCAMDRSFGARCDIAKRNWRTPPKPRSCDLDFGQGVAVGSHGRAHFVCAGDTALGARRILAYGHARRVGRYSCTSKRVGMRCVNRRSGHGFFLSRQRFRLF
jgi:hypothetical protein